MPILNTDDKNRKSWHNLTLPDQHMWKPEMAVLVLLMGRVEVKSDREMTYLVLDSILL